MSSGEIDTNLLIAASIAAERLIGPTTLQQRGATVRELLIDSSRITDADRAAVQEMKTFISNALTLEILKNDSLSDFCNKILTIVSKEVVSSSLVGVAAHIPKFYNQTKVLQQTESRLLNCEREYIGEISTKVQTTIEVVRMYYSQKYSCNFVTGITDDNKRVLFAYSGSTQLEVNQKYSIKATVKRHDDDWATALARVKPVKI